MIDAHVHLRDWDLKDKDTVKHGLEVARDSGVDAVFDMPNTMPTLTTRDAVEKRILLMEEAEVPEVSYHMYLGITTNEDQLREAVKLFHEYGNRIIGSKLFAGKSTGNLEIISEKDQLFVMNWLTKLNYTGVLAIHCEKESEMYKGGKEYEPDRPISHSELRPEIAEVRSIEDQIKFARESNFSGKIHIPHISTPGGVELVYAAKQNGMDISCGICPHHFIYDNSKLEGKDGALFKMNPALRKPESRDKMLEYLRAGKIDFVESDHAPHEIELKRSNDPPSGIPGLPWWPLFGLYLRHKGFPKEQIIELTHTNINKRFGLDIPHTERPLVYRGNDYGYNPYKEIEELLNWNN